MRKRYSEEQNVRILSEAAKSNVAGIRRKYGISGATLAPRFRPQGCLIRKSLGSNIKKIPKSILNGELEFRIIKQRTCYECKSRGYPS